MAGSAASKTTTNHEEIKKWVEARDGHPAIVKGTSKDGDGGGVLRINYPGYAEDNLEDISWDEFFKIFDKNKLKFLYQEETSEGKTSRFSKFVN